ncbi:hypothetical protein [Peribacillus frigoritolerans]|uniref:hypothetical protein n=1 Tax=Peribacillus frigoritolerans TaxID=450367 RepID=UPI0032E4B70B
MNSDKVTFFGSPTSAISSSVAVPQNYNRLLFSGTVPPLLNKDGKTTYERYGNTERQAIGILETLKADLKTKGLSLAMKMNQIIKVGLTPMPSSLIQRKIQ